MFNSAKMFEKLFVPAEGGYLFYPWRWSGGYLITPAERDRLISDWRAVVGFRGMLKLFGVVLALMIVSLLIFSALGVLEHSEPYLGYVIGMGFVAYLFWKFSAVYRLIRGRDPIAPRQSKEESRTKIGSMLSWPALIFITSGITFFSAFLLLLASQGSWLAGAIGLVVVWSAYEYFKIIGAKWRSRGDR